MRVTQQDRAELPARACHTHEIRPSVNLKLYNSIHMVILTHSVGHSLSLTASLPHCLTQDEFELVGSILGLACYNNVIVDAHLPLPAYKKLMGLVREPEAGAPQRERERAAGVWGERGGWWEDSPLPWLGALSWHGAASGVLLHPSSRVHQ